MRQWSAEDVMSFIVWDTGIGPALVAKRLTAETLLVAMDKVLRG